MEAKRIFIIGQALGHLPCGYQVVGQENTQWPDTAHECRLAFCDLADKATAMGATLVFAAPIPGQLAAALLSPDYLPAEIGFAGPAGITWAHL